jgi:hypothetical protein
MKGLQYLKEMIYYIVLSKPIIPFYSVHTVRKAAMLSVYTGKTSRHVLSRRKRQAL